jgi:hypothetical protein
MLFCPSGKLRDLEQVKGNEFFFILCNLHSFLMEGNDYSVRRNCCQAGKTHCIQTGGSFPAYKLCPTASPRDVFGLPNTEFLPAADL